MTTTTTSTFNFTNTTSTVSQHSSTLTSVSPTLTSQTPLTTAIIAGTGNQVSSGTNNHDISQPQSEVPSTIPTQNNQHNPTPQPQTTSASYNENLTYWIIKFCVVPNNKPIFLNISTPIRIPQTPSCHMNSSEDNSQFLLGLVLPIHQDTVVGGRNSADNLGYYGQILDENNFEPQPGPSGLYSIKRPHAAEEDVEPPTKRSKDYDDSTDFNILDSFDFNPADQFELESWDMSGYNYDEILEESQYYKHLYFNFIKD